MTQPATHVFLRGFHVTGECNCRLDCTLPPSPSDTLGAKYRAIVHVRSHPRSDVERRQLSRDGLLAIAACALMLLGVVTFDIDTRRLADPLLMSGGCVGMVCIELLLLRVPDLTRRLWGRPVVRIVSTLGVVAGGGFAVAVGAAWALVLLIWGLLAYIVLVGVVAATGHNPLTHLV